MSIIKDLLNRTHQLPVMIDSSQELDFCSSSSDETAEKWKQDGDGSSATKKLWKRACSLVRYLEPTCGRCTGTAGRPWCVGQRPSLQQWFWSIWCDEDQGWEELQEALLWLWALTEYKNSSWSFLLLEQPDNVNRETCGCENLSEITSTWIILWMNYHQGPTADSTLQSVDLRVRETSAPVCRSAAPTGLSLEDPSPSSMFLHAFLFFLFGGGCASNSPLCSSWSPFWLKWLLMVWCDPEGGAS